MGNFWSYLSVTALMIVGVLLIFIILLQRGRGGGLAGAFGGAGGQSALGTKAGDVFTRITVGLVVIWVLLACFSIYALRAGSEGRLSGLPSADAGERLEPGTAADDAGTSAAPNAGAAGTSTATNNEPKAAATSNMGESGPALGGEGGAAPAEPPAQPANDAP